MILSWPVSVWGMVTDSSSVAVSFDSGCQARCLDDTMVCASGKAVLSRFGWGATTICVCGGGGGLGR
jgi:hypothetical protein